MIKRTILSVIVIMLLFSACAFALDTYSGYNLPVDIEINGSFIKCSEKPIIIDGSAYIPLRAFSDATGGAIEWNETEMAATMLKNGHSFKFYINHGYAVTDGEVKNYAAAVYKGLTFVPVRAVSETLGYSVSWDDYYSIVKISAPQVEIPQQFRDLTYTCDDILYLGKIIQIESGYQPFEVKLGVGGTIVNRIKSPSFPNSVKSVIFDKKYGTQFPPAHTDKINITPSYESIIAAKCALNGVNNIGNSLYFIEKRNAASSWAARNRKYYATLGDMCFYE